MIEFLELQTTKASVYIECNFILNKFEVGRVPLKQYCSDIVRLFVVYLNLSLTLSLALSLSYFLFTIPVEYVKLICKRHSMT